MPAAFVALPFLLLACVPLPGFAQEAATPAAGSPAPAQAEEHDHPSLSGTLVDAHGKVVPLALVTLKQAGRADRQTVSDDSGHFVFAGNEQGSFQLQVDALGFAAKSVTGQLRESDALVLPDLFLSAAGTVTDVQVTVTRQELAEEQIKEEEKQRVFGAVPNFYVSYDHGALPLVPRQKWELVWKSSIDPFTLLATGVAAGIEQGTNAYSGYGQGAQGYAKRYAAGYGDGVINGVLSAGVLPILFKQDPRYFWKGTGTAESRALYAIANSVICKGDNGHWEVDYSGLLGGLAAGGISNLYYPASDRNGAGLTFENFAVGVGTGALANLFQEFLVKKLTPHSRHSGSSSP